jgi:hypothetical protein
VTRRPAGLDPFGVLGLEPSRDLSDDDVRAAWRRIAAATHPDRADGGDLAAFAAAADAYTVLRTVTGRGEALADLLASAGGRRALRVARTAAIATGAVLLAVRVWRGRPLVLGLRTLIAGACCSVAVAAAGWQPASFAIVTGALTWLALTVPSDLAPPPA